MSRHTCIDAFCGAGGLSLGLIRAGFQLLFGFDVDRVSISTLKLNSDHVHHSVFEADIRELLGGRIFDRVNIAYGALDLLAGGPPCQGFSVQRTIGGDHDDRNSLIDQYAMLIGELRPRFFLMENVLGLRGKRGEVQLASFKAKVASLGYLPHERVLNAADFGVPQRRKRLIIVGERLDGVRPCFTWPNPLENERMTVRSAIGHLPPPPADGTVHPDHPSHRADRLSPLNRARLASLRAGQSRVDLPPHLVAACHKTSAEVTGHRNVYGRMDWDEVAPTITARFDSFTRGKFGHPEQIRSISLLEGALLQTFPSTFRFVGTKVEVARQIGNAVPPVLAHALGRQIRMALELRSAMVHECALKQ